MDGLAKDMRFLSTTYMMAQSTIWSGTGITNGLSRTTNDTGWDIPLAGPLLLKKEAVQLVVCDMEWDGATHGRASAINEAGWHTSYAGLKWDGATHGWASAANESGQHTSMADPSIIRNETVKVMDRPAKEIGLPSTTNVLAHPRYGLQRPAQEMRCPSTAYGLAHPRYGVGRLTHRGASATNEAGWDTSWVILSKIRNDTEQVVDGPPKEMRQASAIKEAGWHNT
ncbi:hypothetical protein EDD16DRAFT_1523025 [Pisolithus croceorrhizus]|nr:hypothetical protein EDD16DRAFT_1523025 [Pisolithus croceorrhizus]